MHCSDLQGTFHHTCQTSTRTEQIYVLTTREAEGKGFDPEKVA